MTYTKKVFIYNALPRMQPQDSTLYISPIGHSVGVQSIITVARNQLKRITVLKNE